MSSCHQVTPRRFHSQLPPLRTRFSTPPTATPRISENVTLKPSISLSLGRSNATTRRSNSSSEQQQQQQQQQQKAKEREECMADELAALVQAAIDDIAAAHAAENESKRKPSLAKAKLLRPFSGMYHDGEEEEAMPAPPLLDVLYEAVAPDPLVPTPSTTTASFYPSAAAIAPTPVSAVQPGRPKADEYFRLVAQIRPAAEESNRAPSRNMSMSVDVDVGFADALEEAMRDLLEGFRVKRSVYVW